jgi:hypothetical protein
MLQSMTLRVADDSEIPMGSIGVRHIDAPPEVWKISLRRGYIPAGSGGRGRTRLWSLADATGKPGTDVRFTEMGRVRR